MGKQLKKSNKGFSLMEVLIAIIVVAIGLLGFLTLQLTSINSNQDGMFRSQATLIAQDLGSRMRANREYIYSAGETETDGKSEYLNVSNYNNCDAPPALECTGTASCTAQQQARYDGYEICLLKNGFTAADTTTSDNPFPVSRVGVGCSTRDATKDCAPGSTHTIYVFWAASAKRADAGQTGSIRNSRCDAFAAATAGVDLSTLASEVDCLVTDIKP